MTAKGPAMESNTTSQWKCLPASVIGPKENRTIPLSIVPIYGFILYWSPWARCIHIYSWDSGPPEEGSSELGDRNWGGGIRRRPRSPYEMIIGRGRWLVYMKAVVQARKKGVFIWLRVLIFNLFSISSSGVQDIIRPPSKRPHEAGNLSLHACDYVADF